MPRHIATVEFRYHKKPRSGTFADYVSKKITLGIYDSRDDAIRDVNKLLPLFEERFPLNPNYRIKRRFSQDSFRFGRTAIQDSSDWIRTPFDLYIVIDPLCEDSLADTLDTAIADVKEYQQWRDSMGDET